MRSWRSDFSMVVIAIVAWLGWGATATAQTEFKLTASDAAAHDHFGNSVSVSGDYAIVGAYFDDDAGDGSGSAYIFFRSGTTWSQQAKLTASDATEGDRFSSRSVSIDGEYAIVGLSHTTTAAVIAALPTYSNAPARHGPSKPSSPPPMPLQAIISAFRCL